MSDCIEWTKSRLSSGYGQVRHNGRMQRAHRVAWEKIHGPIPDGLQVLHKCDNPACVNPDHLFLGSRSDNMRDMISKGRQNWKSTLTDEQVIGAMARMLMGHKQTHIAADLGVSSCLLSLIWSGKRWAHLFADITP